MEQTNQLNLKKYPTNASKKEIQEMYWKLSEKTVRTAIQLAVDIVNRDSKIKYTKSISKLNSKHIALIVEELGEAPGYCKI